MRIIIVASSPYQTFKSYQYQDDDYLIGIEDGAYQILQAGYQLDLAIGDFDTTRYFEEIKKHASKMKVFSPIKNEIDLELALRYILDEQLKGEIIIYNACMGRMDHELVTIKLLAKYHELSITLISEQEEIIYLKKDYCLAKGKMRFSLIPFEEVELEIINALYPLPKTCLSFEDNYTSSNETLSDVDTIIKIYQGGIILIKQS